MGVDLGFDITAGQRKTILALLERHLPGTAAWVYGSRAKWTARPQSDLDLVVFAAPGQSGRVGALREAFEESNLPFRVDLFVWDEVPEEFRKQIEAEHVVLPPTPGSLGMAGDAIESSPTIAWLYRPTFPEHWERRSLHSLAKWVNGLAFRDIQFSSSGKPVIKIAEIKGGISGQTKFTNQTFDDSVRIQPGDLLFSWSGQPETSIDAFWWRGPEGWLNQHIFRVTPADCIDTTFFYYLLRYLNPNFVAIARNKQTTGLGHVTKRDLENIQAAFPCLSKQRAVAHVLGTLDDKIELNRRMNETLEAMARALFKSWFVDFDPVRAKMEGREPYLASEIWDLFPDNLDDEGKPEGWQLRSISEFANVVYGAPFASWQFNTDKVGVPLIRIRDLATHEPGVSTEQVHKKGHLIEPGDIVVGMDGEFRLHVWKGPKAWLNQRVCHFGPKHGVPKAFLAEALTEPLAFFERGKVGTTVIHLGKSDIDTFEILQPGQALLRAFASVAQPLLDRTVVNALQSRTLAQTRDLLLPKLISGEIRVPATGQAVETTT